MRFLSLFSGVGGLDCAVEAAFGATVVAHCEADPYCRRVLARHWPGVPCFEDVRTLSAAEVSAIDCICGGFPCTDLSTAGKQAGLSAARSGLWWEYLRLIRELRPGLVVIENVPPLYRKPEWRRQVQEPLEALGYRVLWTLCKASDVGAPHRRERTFALAVLPGVRVPAVPRVAAVDVDASWPTPSACIANDGEGVETWEARRATLKAKHRNGNGCGTPLTIAVQLWPTPRSEDSESSGAHRGVADTLTLTDVVVRRKGAEWATPAARDYRSGKGRTENGHTPQLPEQVAGVLNPAWVETLVGLPVGWTDAAGSPQRIDFAPLWPMGRGPEQQHWEPPRTIAPKTGGTSRRKRLMALGNIVVPQQAALALFRLAATANDSTRCAFGGAQGVLL